jgi:ABC-type protease/lipase transport system fused ATPase/permease subunit
MVAFSLVTNAVVLVSPLFMMQVLDRVIPSGNLATLGLLALVAGAALLAGAVVAYFRDRILSLSANWMDEAASALVFCPPSAEVSAKMQASECAIEFLRGPALRALLNAIWLPLFFVVLVLIHPIFARLAVGVGLVLLAIKRFGSWFTAKDQRESLENRHRARTIAADLAKEPVITSMMSLLQFLGHRYVKMVQTGLSAREVADKIVHGSDNAARVTAQIAQVSALGLGAALVSQSALSAGGMIGASLIVAKFVGSVDALIGQWSALGTAREAIAALLRAEKMTD